MKFDVVVVGSGFAGSIMSMIARRLGFSVALIERGKHPRFAIGESSTPLANLLLEELARTYDLPRLLPLTSWGAWQKQHPDLPVGLKRGFTFLHHRFHQPFSSQPPRANQLLVAASPSDDVADTHWFRAGFDEFLLGEARSLGVNYFPETRLDTARSVADGMELEGPSLRCHAGFVIDATGPRGFLHDALGLKEIKLEDFPQTEALFTHFTAVKKLADPPAFASHELPPFPPDDAAVHHLFPGGWMWVLRFNHGVTSAGVAVEKSLAQELDLKSGAKAWEKLLERLPFVREQFAAAHPERPLMHVPRLSFLSDRWAGPRWALLPSAGGFVDPLLSTGFPLVLLGIKRLAHLLEVSRAQPSAEDLDEYSVPSRGEFDAARRLVSALYASLDDFEVFEDLSLLYFAAMIFSEAARRMGQPELARSFLLHDDPVFGPQLRACCQGSGESRDSRRARIRAAIEPLDLSRLLDPARRHWHPYFEDQALARRILANHRGENV